MAELNEVDEARLKLLTKLSITQFVKQARDGEYDDMVIEDCPDCGQTSIMRIEPDKPMPPFECKECPGNWDATNAEWVAAEAALDEAEHWLTTVVAEVADSDPRMANAKAACTLAEEQFGYGSDEDDAAQKHFNEVLKDMADVNDDLSDAYTRVYVTGEIMDGRKHDDTVVSVRKAKKQRKS